MFRLVVLSVLIAVSLQQCGRGKKPIGASLGGYCPNGAAVKGKWCCEAAPKSTPAPEEFVCETKDISGPTLDGTTCAMPDDVVDSNGNCCAKEGRVPSPGSFICPSQYNVGPAFAEICMEGAKIDANGACCLMTSA